MRRNEQKCVLLYGLPFKMKIIPRQFQRIQCIHCEQSTHTQYDESDTYCFFFCRHAHQICVYTYRDTAYISHEYCIDIQPRRKGYFQCKHITDVCPPYVLELIPFKYIPIPYGNLNTHPSCGQMIHFRGIYSVLCESLGKLNFFTLFLTCSYQPTSYILLRGNVVQTHLYQIAL